MLAGTFFAVGWGDSDFDLFGLLSRMLQRVSLLEFLQDLLELLLGNHLAFFWLSTFIRSALAVMKSPCLLAFEDVLAVLSVESAFVAPPIVAGNLSAAALCAYGR